jgi:acyl-coenzyme A synthetase/AMP-(fatty) acid ligase/aryl carrier-like protein
MPKGIGVQHRPIVNLIGWVNGTLGVVPGDRLLFVTSLGFDLSVYDVFGILAAGGTIHIAPEAALRDPGRLAAILRDEPITIWDSAPAALQQIAPLFPDDGLKRPLRLVKLSGDWIPVPLPDQVRAAFPGVRVISYGGATEASVWSNWYPVGRVDPAWPSIPYGRPIANARYFVLDGELSPCPIGVPGDLYIGGMGGAVLSVGYVYQSDLTAASFIPDPYSDEPGARLYRTGDRARAFADGNLEFLGRIDLQVKIRGYRIELGEIETSLLRHPGVSQAVVLAREDVPGEKRLVAYIIPKGPAPSAADLRTFLQETLPEYMVPWAFVEIESLPVTGNGKLDREALPAPRDIRPQGTAFVAPRNDLERAIATAWREVLQLEEIGVQESFFEVGGSSLLLARLQSRLRETLGREVPFVELFRHPTIESLAQSLEQAPEEKIEEKAEQARARTESRRESMRQLQQKRASRRGVRDE